MQKLLMKSKSTFRPGTCQQVRLLGGSLVTKENPASQLCQYTHLPGEDSFLFSSENAERVLATTISLLERYLARPVDTMFDDVRYCEYYEQFMVSKSLLRESWRDEVPDHQIDVRVPETERREGLQNEHALPQCGRKCVFEAPPTPHRPKIFCFDKNC